MTGDIAICIFAAVYSRDVPSLRNVNLVTSATFITLCAAATVVRYCEHCGCAIVHRSF